MKKLPVLLFLSAVLSAGLMAQTPNSTNPGASRYALSDCRNRVKAFDGRECGLIFIGDSITEGWRNNGKSVWEKRYEKRNALNFGIGGDTTQDVLWRFENFDLSKIRPKVAVVLIGTNNTKDTPADIAAGVKAVVDKARERFAGVKIILVGILPNKRATEKMSEANRTIKTFADEKTVFFLDLGREMTPIETTGADGTPDTNWKGLLPDRLHLSEEGYQLWADTMEPLLKDLLQEIP